MLSKPERLRRARDFALLSQKGRVVFGPYVTLRFRQSSLATKVGFVTSAKIFKTAVERNRTKRRLREVLRALKVQWPKQMDLLFIAKREAMTAEYAELQSSIKRMFEKIPDALKLPPRPKALKAKRKTSIVYKENV
jgi:ribonuclease P protein component